MSGRVLLYGGLVLILIGLAIWSLSGNSFLRFFGISLLLVGPVVSSLSFFARKRRIE